MLLLRQTMLPMYFFIDKYRYECRFHWQIQVSRYCLSKDFCMGMVIAFWRRSQLLLRSNFSLFHNIFNISLTSRVQLHIYLSNVVVWIIFSSILQIWYVEVRISRSSSISSLELEITKVDCIFTPGSVWHSVFRSDEIHLFHSSFTIMYFFR